MPNNGKATIREVYDGYNRLDDKIDKNHLEVMKEIYALKKQVAVYAGTFGGGASVVIWIITKVIS